MTLEPDAWLIREIRGTKATVMCGQMFKSKETADAAALRMTNHWRTCEAFPVASLANVEGTPLIDTLFDALSKASVHLDYCGYGDSWERECANHSKLPELVEAALTAGRAAGLEEKE